MSKKIELTRSLSSGLFGTTGETVVRSQVAATDDSSKVAGVVTSSRAKGWAAALALTVAGLTATKAVAMPLATDKNNDHNDAADASADAKTADGQAGKPVNDVHKFDIPAGTLGDVIAAIRKQAGIRIALASVDKMSTVPSNGVHGVLTVKEALTQALDTTGLEARFDTPDSATIDIRQSSDSVVVSADATPNMKYTAPLRDMPATITVIGEDTLQATASTTLMDALRTVPGITFGAGEGGNPLGDRPFIRGLDSQSSTYIDGMRDIAAQTRETFDVDSIEVQEGPGGAYGGRGTGGGSININSKIAQKNSFIAGSFTPGTSNYKRFTVDGNTKLNSLMYGRLTGLWHDAGVAGRDGVHQGRWGFAPSLAVGLGHPTRLFLDYYHLVQNNIPDSGIPYNNPLITNGLFVAGASYTADKNAGLKQILQPGDGEPIALPYRTIFYGLSDRDKDNEYAKIGTGRVERDLWNGHALLRNSFRYERTDEDYVWTLPDDSQGNLYFGYLFRRINSKFNAVFTADDQTDLSGTVKTGSIKHSYATGFEFSKERSNIDSYTNSTTYYTATAPPKLPATVPTGTESCPEGIGAASAYNCVSLFSPNLRDPWVGASATGLNGITYSNQLYLNHNPTHDSTVSKGVYGFDTITFNQHFQATVGGRFDSYTSVSRVPASTTLTTGAPVPAASYNVENNLGTYMAGVVYKPDTATSIYATVSTAAIPTGNSLGQGTDVSTVANVINDNLLPEKIREEEFGVKRELDGGKALARIAVYREDIQNVRIATDAAGDVSNAGADRTIGLEATVSGHVTRKLDFTGGYSFMDARLTASPYTAAAGVVGATNGQFMPNTPWSSFTATSNYEITHKLKVGGGVYANSMVWGSQANNKWVKGYTRVDLFGGYEISKHASLTGNVLNLGDKVYYQQAYATHYAILGVGRTVEFGLNWKY